MRLTLRARGHASSRVRGGAVWAGLALGVALATPGADAAIIAYKATGSPVTCVAWHRGIDAAAPVTAQDCHVIPCGLAVVADAPAGSVLMWRLENTADEQAWVN